MILQYVSNAGIQYFIWVFQNALVMLSCLLRSLRPQSFSEPITLSKSMIFWLKKNHFDVLKKKNFND